jgi:hypothetical protein
MGHFLGALINISCGLYAFKLLKTPAVCNVFSKTGTLHSTAGQGGARGFFCISSPTSETNEVNSYSRRFGLALFLGFVR